MPPPRRHDFTPGAGVVACAAAAVPRRGALLSASPIVEAPTVRTPAEDAATQDITAWLARLADEPDAAEQVYRLLYDELHGAARRQMRREDAGHTLSATALVSEAWLRLAQQQRTRWQSRGHFVAVASTIMRRILVDHALARRAAKRAAPLQTLSTTLAERHGDAPDTDVVALHEALLALAEHDERAARVVELKFFGGLEVEEIAQTLAVSPATVKRDWALARAWLRRELGGAAAGPDAAETRSG